MDDYDSFSKEERDNDNDQENDRTDQDRDERILLITELFSGAFFFFFCNIEARIFINDNLTFGCVFVANGNEIAQRRRFF